MNYRYLSIVLLSVFMGINAQDSFLRGNLSIVMQQGPVLSDLIHIRQLSRVTGNGISPQAITLEINYSKIQELAQMLIGGEAVPGSRIIVSASSMDNQDYQLDQIHHAALVFMPNQLVFEPINKFNEQVPLVMHYSVRELATAALLCKNRMAATYCLDISDPETLKDFSELLLQACTVDGEIKLPSLGKVLELLAIIRMQFSEKIVI